MPNESGCGGKRVTEACFLRGVSSVNREEAIYPDKGKMFIAVKGGCMS